MPAFARLPGADLKSHIKREEAESQDPERDDELTAGKSTHRLPVSVDDAAPSEIVGGELDAYPIAEEDTDAVAPHFSGCIAEGLVAVVQEDPKHAVS